MGKKASTYPLEGNITGAMLLGLNAALEVVQFDITNIVGAEGPEGPEGPQGPRGFSLLSGTLDPEPSDGIDGDYYLDTVEGILYGPKEDGEWPAGISLIGPQGPQGDPGDPGPAGADGPQGIQGPVGPQGAGLIPDEYGNLNEAKVASVQSADVDWVFVVNPSGDTRANKATPAGINGDMSLHIIRYDATTNGWTDYGQFTGVQGPAGPQGAQGNPGVPGANGSNGTDGRTILSGAAAPSNGFGSNGDFYLETTNGRLYGPKTAGAWGTGYITVKGTPGTPGAAGPAGASGSKIYSGSTAPPSGTGVVGDYYMRTDTGQFYEKTGTTTWTVRVVLKGDTGAAGASGGQLLSGTAAPTTEGQNGDWYLRTTTGVLYSKSGTWGIVMTLKGTDGTNGTNGVNGGQLLSGSPVPTTEGQDGDWYLRTATGVIYKKAAGTWSSMMTLKGTNGGQLLSGTDVPTSQGSDGDWYLRTATGALYSKSGGIWTLTMVLKGADGAAGQGVPAGGSTGQILAKINGTNYNTTWIDAPSGGGGSGGVRDIRTALVIEDDFMGSGAHTSGRNGINNTLSGGAANMTFDAGGTISPSRRYSGVCELSTLSANSNYAQLNAGGAFSITPSHAKVTSRTGVAFGVLGDGSNNYEAAIGHSNNINDIATSLGIAVRYKSDVNGGRWQITTRNGVPTLNNYDTGIAVVANTWYDIVFEFNSDGSTVTVKINGTSFGPYANPYTATLGLGAAIRKTLGTSARTMTIDYMQMIVEYTGGRAV